MAVVYLLSSLAFISIVTFVVFLIQQKKTKVL
jgi:hypothetical protein